MNKKITVEGRFKSVMTLTDESVKHAYGTTKDDALRIAVLKCLDENEGELEAWLENESAIFTTLIVRVETTK